MDLSPITAATTAPEPMDARKASMRDAAEQVEGLFLKILMKEGMKSMIEESGGHSSSAMAYALEQAADDAGRAGSLGIADEIYEQLSNSM